MTQIYNSNYEASKHTQTNCKQITHPAAHLITDLGAFSLHEFGHITNGGARAQQWINRAANKESPRLHDDGGGTTSQN